MNIYLYIGITKHVVTIFKGSFLSPVNCVEAAHGDLKHWKLESKAQTKKKNQINKYFMDDLAIQSVPIQ